MLMQTSALPLTPFRRGKVRDVYEVDAKHLLLVATDRVSAFDVVMGETIPHKGAVLTQITAWWLRQLEPRIQHHMLSADISEIVRQVPSLRGHEQELAGRSMLARKSMVFPIECVVRGYISGSAWKEYRERGTLAGERLPKGLRESDRLDPPIFSPATKAEERAGRWDGNYPPPRRPKEVIETTSARYLDIYRRLTGHSLDPNGRH